MTRAYLRLDPNLRRLKKDYPDGAFRAFVELLCASETQPQRGRFESRPLLMALLGPRRRWVGYLIDHGDLGQDGDELFVIGWNDWQEGDITVPERMSRLRAKKAGVTPPVTADVTADVTVPTVYTPSERLAVGGKRLAEADGRNDTTLKDAADAYYSITGRFPSETVLEWLNRLGRVYGEELTSSKISEQYLADSNRRTLLSRTEEALKAATHKRKPSQSHDGQHPNCAVCAPLQAAQA